MKYLRIILAVAAILFATAPVRAIGPAITFVQGQVSSGFGSTLTMTNPPKLGDVVIVMVNAHNGLTSITDANGTALSQIAATVQAGTNSFIAIYRYQVTSVPATGVYTFNGATSAGLIQEVSNVTLYDAHSTTMNATQPYIYSYSHTDGAGFLYGCVGGQINTSAGATVTGVQNIPSFTSQRSVSGGVLQAMIGTDTLSKILLGSTFGTFSPSSVIGIACASWSIANDQLGGGQF